MSEPRRLWLVDRSFDDGRIITVTYATMEGDATLTKQYNLPSISDGVPVSLEAQSDELTHIEDEKQRTMYRDEAERVRSQHTPDDRV